MKPNPVLRKLGLSDTDRAVIIHMDDVASAQAANAAYADLVDFGLISSAAVMVPCAWFPDAAAFFSSPIIERYFLPGWFELLPDDATRQRMHRTLAAIIDRERHHIDFDVSIKATIVIGQK